ncbi:hypothetical protein ABZW18_01030 [Streptomyces sp. NPDC004647]|uniref:hypothetical protein n=1 Tax=Streptomyces sp. NPDC004647 TaxID=3154671 RepID=UPI0033A2EF41
MTRRVAAADPVPAGERGATRIADRVVAKIASQAAREALRGAAEAHRVPPGRGPHATVSLRRAAEAAERGGPAGEARVRVAVELGYPCDIGAQCHAVRRVVTERVLALAGMDVPEVSVFVERLHSVHSQAGEQGRVT